ncbi:MAG TPA: beta-ketoacyl-[acyl-carrier-protein] synthase family protein [Candidatus Dormibacteraeota bacterium]|nr:beta-ketoacyl-[acyl-carrier-protein] synthase family protein [Candidatus Dormibacteraeota bacterium]
MTRIAITGIGSINALGVGVEAFAAGLREGRCGIGTLTRFAPEGYRTSCAAEAPWPEVPAEIPVRTARRLSHTARLALVAAAEAWRASGLADGRACGVVLGTTTGGMAGAEESYRRESTGDCRRQSLASWLETPVAVATDAVAALIGSHGPRVTVSTACSSGANALGIAADWIRAGQATAVLCGGAESLCRMTYSGFNVLQALDRVPCRPFDRDRAGLSLGEGAALFVLEDWAAAQRRGARILGELLGYGVSADAHHLTQPRPDGAGAILAMQRALADAGVGADAIDYVNAHGTGTPLNDAAETRAIKTVLGARAYAVPVSSTKSQVGHCLAAAGAIEALAALLAVRGGFLPPTATLRAPDPECDLDYVPEHSRPAALRIVLSNSYGFGGNNTSVVLGSAEGAAP